MCRSRPTRPRLTRTSEETRLNLQLEEGRLDLHADCERCFGLCCVAPAFSAPADFAIDKAAGLDVAAHRQAVNALLLRASELVRAGAPRQEAELRGADLTGRDLSGADLRGASGQVQAAAVRQVHVQQHHVDRRNGQDCPGLCQVASLDQPRVPQFGVCAPAHYCPHQGPALLVVLDEQDPRAARLAAALLAAPVIRPPTASENFV